MKPITLSQAQKLTSPNPFALVTSCDASGKPNLMALSWWTYVSNRPATVAICLSQKGYTGSLIEQTGVFGLNIVDEVLKDAAFQCGCCSGRTVDKAAEFNIPLVPAAEIAAPLVEHSRVSFECRLIQTVPVQDHAIFIAEVVAIQGDETARALYAQNGYGALSAL